MIRARAAGFTLLELIVVIAIFAVLAVMAYGGLNSVLNTRRGVEASLDRTAALQRAYIRLRGDLQQATMRPIRDGFGQKQPAFNAGPEGVEFSRGGWRNPAQLPRASVERVAYRLVDGVLVRESWRVLDRPQESTTVRVPLLDQIEEASWRFLAPNDEWATDWLANAAPTAGAGQISDPLPPRAVELKLKTRDLGELLFVFRLPVEGVMP